MSLSLSAEWLASAMIGCALGLWAVHALGDTPLMLATIIVVMMPFMVTFRATTLAVAIRSGLVPLAAFFLQSDTMAAGQARCVCILIAVPIGTTSMLILSSDRVGGVLECLLNRIGSAEVPRMR